MSDTTITVITLIIKWLMVIVLGFLVSMSLGVPFATGINYATTFAVAAIIWGAFSK